MSLFKSLPEIPLTVEKAKTTLEKLYQELSHHNYCYYELNQPKISDEDYDILFQEAIAIEKAYPNLKEDNAPTKKVGYTPLGKFEKVTHSVPMLSLDNAFREETLADFIKRIRKFLSLEKDVPLEFMAEPKIDGLSAALRYEKGHLVLGCTRGDGTVGENITHTLKTIRSIPHQLKGDDYPDFLEIRGEVFLSKQDFLALNKEREKEGLSLFANPRNAAAGSVRQLDASIAAKRPLQFFAYSLAANPQSIKTQRDLLDCLKKWGFSLADPINLCTSLEDLLAYYHHIERERNQLPYDIDGVVYKVNRFDYQGRLGQVSRAPRWAIAHKFQAEQGETLLKSITIQVGRTGVLTPVAELEPINLGGVLVSRATLHNADELHRKDIREGDRVLIQRAGDVIPQVVRVLSIDASCRKAPFIFPTHCPICHSHAVQEPDEVATRCTGGFNCAAQTKERLKHFVSRHAFDIEGLGGRSIDFFWEEKRIQSPIDIFTLEERDSKTNPHLKEISGWGEKSAENLFQAIREKTTISFDRFLYALGIRHIGQVTARALALVYKTGLDWYEAMEKMFERGIEGEEFQLLLSIDMVGETIALSLYEFFKEPLNKKMVKDLIDLLTITPVQQSQGILSGKMLLFTGTLQAMTREEAKQKAESLGAKITSGLSSQTTFLVAGEKPGSKIQKAQKLGISVLSEQEWLQLIKNPEET
jgi:DNA ligase (NAD+)